VRFTEYGDSGDSLTEGEARRVVYFTDTENATLTGTIRVHSNSEKAEIVTESLAWENGPKRLTGSPDQTVTLRKEDGSFLSGRGFIGDFKNKTLRFTGSVQGIYVSEAKKGQ
jgi:hypothetical protein